MLPRASSPEYYGELPSLRRLEASLNKLSFPVISPRMGGPLQHYPGQLSVYILKILQFGAMLGYTGPKTLLLSKNLSSAFLLPQVMEEKIQADLRLGRIAETTPTFPLISSPLGFVPKPNGSWRKIHHLSFPEGSSVNDYIFPESAYIQYVSFENVLGMVRRAGKGCLILRRDMKDAFRIIPVAPHQRWLLAFEWAGKYYTECVLPFGLSTAPFIFNLFAEAWHWILQSYLGWELLEHYLDDNMAAIKAIKATPELLIRTAHEYKLLCAIVGIIRNDEKDACGTEVVLLGRLVNSVTQTISVPQDKLNRVILLTQKPFNKDLLPYWRHSP